MTRCAPRPTIWLTLGALLCLLACPQVDDDTPADDDDIGDDDDQDDDVQDDDAQDDDATPGTNPLSNGVEFDIEHLAEDPCDPVYEPRDPRYDDPLVPALRTARGIGTDPTPTRVRTGFSGDATDSFAALWETDLDTTASVIEWGENSTMENRRTVYSYKTGSDYADKIRVHKAVLCDLQPDTTYVYRVGIDGAFSRDYLYTTFDPADTRVSAVVLGDSRSGEEVLQGMLDQAMFHLPELMLHTGDFVGWGPDVQAWGDFFDASSQLFPWIPLVPVHGNHETFAAEFWGVTAMPSDDGWYSVDVGPLHIAVLNSSVAAADLPLWAQWLAADLTASTAEFNIVAMHHCLFSSGIHGSDDRLQYELEHIFDWHHVDVVFSGHDHGYERTYPMYSKHVANSADEGTIYVVTGGAGAPLYAFDRDFFTAAVDSSYHYGHLTIDGPVLNYTAYRDDGTMMDHFQIDKTP